MNAIEKQLEKALEHERDQFQRETLQTSKLLRLLDEIDGFLAVEHWDEKHPKECKWCCVRQKIKEAHVLPALAAPADAPLCTCPLPESPIDGCKFHTAPEAPSEPPYIDPSKCVCEYPDNRECPCHPSEPPAFTESDMRKCWRGDCDGYPDFAEMAKAVNEFRGAPEAPSEPPADAPKCCCGMHHVPNGPCKGCPVHAAPADTPSEPPAIDQQVNLAVEMLIEPLRKVRVSHCDWSGYLVHKENSDEGLLEYDENCPACVIRKIIKATPASAREALERHDALAVAKARLEEHDKFFAVRHAERIATLTAEVRRLEGK